MSRWSNKNFLACITKIRLQLVIYKSTTIKVALFRDKIISKARNDAFFFLKDQIRLAKIATLSNGASQNSIISKIVLVNVALFPNTARVALPKIVIF